jgi:hypothetical protein
MATVRRVAASNVLTVLAFAMTGPLLVVELAQRGWSATAVGAFAEDCLATLPDDDPLRPRQRLHEDAARGELQGLDAAIAQPPLTHEAQGFYRAFYDPCAPRALAAGWATRAAISAGGDLRALTEAPTTELAASFMSGWTDNADLTRHAALDPRPGLWGAANPALAEAADAQEALDRARAWTATLDAEEVALRDAAADAGDELLDGLGLVPRFRQEALVARARRALIDDQPAIAEAFLQLAHDAARPDANSPSVAILRAEAELRQGRARAALDALHPVVDRPAARPAAEIIADLAVLQGLDRHGDSKEDP